MRSRSRSSPSRSSSTNCTRATVSGSPSRRLARATAGTRRARRRWWPRVGARPAGTPSDWNRVVVAAAASATGPDEQFRERCDHLAAPRDGSGRPRGRARGRHRGARASGRRARPGDGPARNILFCTAVGTTRSSASIADHVAGGVEHVAGDDVRPREHREGHAGLVAQPRQEADPGAVHDGVGGHGRDDLASQRMRRPTRVRTRSRSSVGK